MAAGEIYQMTVVAIHNAEPIANVFYLKVLDDTGTTDALADAVDALMTQLVTKIAAFQNQDVGYECVLARRTLPTTSPTRVITSAIVGTHVTDSLPANMAFNFRHYSLNGNKNQRGRWYIGGMTQLFVNKGRLAQSQRGNYEAFISAAIATITQSGRTYRLQHRSTKLNQYWDIDSITLNPIPVKVRNRTPGLCSIS